MTDYARNNAQAILENERLTSRLDDSAADPLLKWGVACAELIGRQAAGLDPEAAEEAMYPRMKAVRRLMKDVAKWMSLIHEMDDESARGFMAGIQDEAAVIYGDAWQAPDPALVAHFMNVYQRQSTPHNIAHLREVIEPAALRETPDAPTG